MSRRLLEDTLKVLSIIRGTTVDGPGFRTAIYLAGCSHKCPGCHNPQSWDPEAGEVMTLGKILEIVKEEDFDVTISGGDPLFNPIKTLKLLQLLKNNGRNIWLYTGYTWEQILESENFKELITWVDVVVDGPYVDALKDLDLPFRGSSNQRIINVRESLKKGFPVQISR